MLTMIRYCAVVAILLLFSLGHLYALEELRGMGPEKERMAYCYSDEKQCQKGSRYRISCAKRCRDLEYRKSECVNVFHHCEVHAPWACYCAEKYKLRKPVLWPMKSMQR